VKGEASADLVQELLHQRFRRTRDRRRAAAQARAAYALCRVHQLTEGDVLRALDLFAGTERIGARDAVFAAVALNRGIGTILSPDRAFDEVSGLRRVDPTDVDAVAELFGR
jgi:predicted nucleic acid-binding protein